ncbi:UbiA family prenyltransferase [Pseudomonas panipatensis]|uniref:4-hydroxybenzoate polyprenyltransferase n=1 Tax=Pseudomonas panipatensis TaxID=428992 RepID=A0A1G8K1L9_9PSED|nr:UbiA family prenyltransferase [Pseudomonas panipatensis]SDI37257.1 4-hydroxybenzoate polyprenyltransferase [Pseudomonas panipatensis]SMP61282.1 4-hydroxybenzoate polyprenyltransferase [Pseudomonas panipatensis]
MSAPLVIDLDGTLIHSDLLLESGLSFLKRHPLQALSPLRWLASGKANLKSRLAKIAPLDVSVLPYNQTVLDLIRREKAQGRRIVLATASHRSYADKIAEHLGLFDQVMASDEHTNLSAQRKRDALVAEFGLQGFDYAGNSSDDLPVWQAARRAYVVNSNGKISRRANNHGNVEEEFKRDINLVRTWIKALRVHQWMKNALIFVPLLASHRLLEPHLLLNGVLAFILFGLCASSVYVLNDLLDLEDDRHHPSKCRRPFASGNLSIHSGLLVFPLLLAGGFLGALLLLPWKFSLALLAYYLLTLAYSFWLKRLMAVDVLVLAMLYTSRIIAGTFAFEVKLTFWMLAFSMFIFLSLALVKRYAELRDARMKGKSQKTRGRGYYPDDLEMIASLGASSGYLSVMVLALYIQDGSTAVLYHYPQLIWLACPLLLFWITRVWMLTHRGLMHDDPVVFAIKDRVSLCIGALFAVIFWVAA